MDLETQVKIISILQSDEQYNSLVIDCIRRKLGEELFNKLFGYIVTNDQIKAEILNVLEHDKNYLNSLYNMVSNIRNDSSKYFYREGEFKYRSLNKTDINKLVCESEKFFSIKHEKSSHLSVVAPNLHKKETFKLTNLSQTNDLETILLPDLLVDIDCFINLLNIQNKGIKIKLNEKKILSLILANTCKKEFINKRLIISVQSIAKCLKEKIPPNYYRDLQEYVVNFQNMYVTIDEKDIKIFDKIQYLEGKGELECIINAQFFYENFNHSNIKYPIGRILKLNHTYSIELYELILCLLENREDFYELETLIEKLKASAKSYKNYSCFKEKILNDVFKDLNENIFINEQLKYEPIKRGRKVIGIKIDLLPNSNKKDK